MKQSEIDNVVRAGLEHTSELDPETARQLATAFIAALKKGGWPDDALAQAEKRIFDGIATRQEWANNGRPT
jgi:hypothetical protein